ncbi:hypothetical protein MFU01_73550 [Myxococcus fulvus]|uniref:Uncharacterized protein n=1 Tax=Myxococcus fulvus TaxID=33 RepID=A0A511TGJ4_MYXFU|nr:hypothetical protein [Myxococcus fulvus]GEN12318.1 hypothetical protein MFU01_73550 [Myxococcus fulvus]
MFKGPREGSQDIRGDNNQQAQGDITNLAVYMLPENLPARLPSLMSAAALRLSAGISATPPPPAQLPHPYSIQQKIEYNAVRAYRSWIDDYGVYGFAVDAAYNEVDAHTPGARTKILRHIWTKYTNIRAELLLNNGKNSSRPADEIATIRAHADRIIHNIRDTVSREIVNSPEKGLIVEDVDFSANAITCHAFINCKILDRPPG